ncbi:MAG TPA: glycosyltransferase family 52, partial [Flavobacterium sp.]|nr:glycosyltransferase family 52 [Flavobacterium sp.]
VRSLIGGVVLNRDASVTLIITQPLSEDSLCKESTKIKLYRSIVNQERAQGKNVYFKSHPREVTQYQFDDPGVLFLPKYFPMEVFNLDQSLGVDKAIAYFSTALYNLKHVQDKVLLGEEFLKSEIRKIEG